MVGVVSAMSSQNHPLLMTKKEMSDRKVEVPQHKAWPEQVVDMGLMISYHCVGIQILEEIIPYDKNFTASSPSVANRLNHKKSTYVSHEMCAENHTFSCSFHF